MVDFAALILYNRGMRERIKFKYEIESATKSFPWLRWLFDSARFNLTLMALIMLSVVLILVETFVSLPQNQLELVQSSNDVLTLVFMVELSLRWLISVSTGSFMRDFWIDILAVVPMFRIFRVGRVLRLLRLFRIFSLGTNVQRRFAFFRKVFTGRLLEYSVISSFAVFAIIFGAVGFSQFETGRDAAISTPIDAFWKSLFSMMAGEYADYPASIGGKLVFLILLMFQMGVFAMLTGTFSAIMYDKLKESAMHKPANPDDLNKHIIICGFSAKAAILATEFLIDPAFKHSEILMVSERANLEDLQHRNIKTHRISILKEDFTRMETLKKAGVERAVAAVILSEDGDNRSTQDIDARTILAALTIEKLNPKIHTSAEIYNEEYASHLKMGGVEDVVIQGEVSGKLLARVAMHEGLLAFFKDLLSRESGNTLTFIDSPAEIIGLNSEEAIGMLNKELGFTMVGVKPSGAPVIVNPRGHKIAATDEILVINPVND
ncbi:MAG: NAD-binding protein [Candidatus Riflebacteria bacterium]|nr:NAD-binding protein [Candidatus Riflebacteria bacterium]